VLLLGLLLLLPGGADAICKSRIINPITDVFWPCIFPIKIAGITILSGPEEGALNKAEDKTGIPICICPISVPPFVRIGIPVSFWEPARILESVKDAFCFPTVGLGLKVNPGFLSGTSSSHASNKGEGHTAGQAHWFIFPVYAMLELLVDFICVEHSGFDIAYITEIDPLWNDDILSLLIHPESLLFANPFAQLACIADSVASNVDYPLSPLFWCMGSWGSAYPLGGAHDHENTTEALVALGSRMIYKLGREGILWDTAINICYAVPSLIWVKHHWRLQLMRPKVGRQCIPVGRSALIWGSAKNIPKPGADNFSILIFRKRRCCAF